MKYRSKLWEKPYNSNEKYRIHQQQIVKMQEKNIQDFETTRPFGFEKISCNQLYHGAVKVHLQKDTGMIMLQLLTDNMLVAGEAIKTIEKIGNRRRNYLEIFDPMVGFAQPQNIEETVKEES